MTILISVICLIIGTVVGYLAAHSRNAALTTQTNMQQERIEALRRRLQEHDTRIAQLTDERTTLHANREALDTQVAHLREALGEQRQQSLTLLQQTRQQYEQQLQQTRQQYEQLMQRAEQQQREAEARQAQLIREQINTASENILKHRAEQLSADNQQQMATLLLKDEILPNHDSSRYLGAFWR